MMKIKFLFIFLMLSSSVFAQSSKNIREGIKLYNDSLYVEAEEQFRIAQQQNQDDFISIFNQKMHPLDQLMHL